MAGDVESAGEPTSPQKSQISKTKLRLINMSDEKAACWRKKKNRSAKASKMKRVAKALERDRMIPVICIFSYFFFRGNNCRPFCVYFMFNVFSV